MHAEHGHDALLMPVEGSRTHCQHPFDEPRHETETETLFLTEDGGALCVSKPADGMSPKANSLR